MPSLNVLSTLGVDGWIEQSIQVADTMLSDFFLSEYSQTFAFPDKVASFPWIMQNYRDNIDRLMEETRVRLTQYLNTQFDDVEVQVAHRLVENSYNRHEMRIFLEMRDRNGEVISLAHLATMENLKVISINKILNDGVYDG